MSSERSRLLKTIPRTGVGRFLLFSVYKFRLKSGYYRRKLPAGAWDSSSGLGKSPFERPTREALAKLSIDEDKLLGAANRIVAGELPYFSNQWFGRVPWNENPATGQAAPWVHWTHISHFGPDQGDIKWIWEPSRFYWVYTLGRAYALTHDEKYAEAFWGLLEDWRAANTPNKGPNWLCAQECSHRLCALVWAAAAFDGAAASSEERRLALWQTVRTLASRIEPTLGYGISQNNNHALTEATAMLLAGISLAGTDAERWEAIGRRNVARFALEQFASDGSQLQSALNYERLALKVSLVAAIMAAKTGKLLPPEVIGRLGQAAAFLFQLQDEGSGFVPNYGSNDGAIAFPLCGNAMPDFRPAIADACYLATGKLAYASGEHDEELLWLFGSDALSAKRAGWARNSQAAKDGGYYTLRNEGAMAMVRCHSHNSWPAHADMLHADLWLDGRNIAYDPGSFAYNDPKDWGESFKETTAHNTVAVDGLSQMRKARRFLWTDWTKSSLLRFDDCFEGEHYGYMQLGLGVIHRRRILASADGFLIVDDLINEGGQAHVFELRWHLDGTAWESSAGGAQEEGGLTVDVESISEISRSLQKGQEQYPATGRSLYYGSLDGGTLLKCAVASSKSTRFVSAVGRVGLQRDGETVRWGEIDVALQPKS